jgi:hypothetical protein
MKYVIIGWLVIIAVFVYFLSQIPIGIEPLTELYFENHTGLPSMVEPNKTYSFAFTVNNLEYRPMNYSYTVIAQYFNHTIIIKNETIGLEDNTSKTIPVDFLIEDRFSRGRIEISLLGRNQTIHMWFNEQSKPAPKINITSPKIANASKTANATKPATFFNWTNTTL